MWESLTRQFCRRVGPSGRVFAFEPDPFTFQFLEFNTRAFANKELIQSAVSDNHEPGVLYLNAHGGTGNSLLNPSNAAASLSVPCVSLDEFFEIAGRPAIDVVKVDVEGAELSVLRGLRQTRARLPTMQLIVEYCAKNLNGSGVEPRALYDELRVGGSELRAIREDGSTQMIDNFADLGRSLNIHGYVNLLCGKAPAWIDG
jgi:FkbM family methyltransferase